MATLPDNAGRQPYRSPYRRPLITLTMIAMLVSTGWYLSLMWVDQLDEAFRAQKSALDRARSQYRSAVEELEIAREYLPRYRAFDRQGMFGGIDRLGWSDGMQSIGQSLLLSDMSLGYKGEQALDTQLKQAFNARQNIYKAVPLTLKFNAQHAGDLFEVMEKAQQKISPLFLPQDCLLAKASSDDQIGFRSDGNIVVTCTLQLLQIEPRKR